MHTLEGVSRTDQYRALGLSTFAFTVCFAVWTIFSIIGVKIKQDLGLSDTQFGLLVATPILTGSISRIFLGFWTEQFGGRIMFPLQMLITAVAVWLLTSVQTYEVFLLAALGLGLAGGSFIVGVAYTSRWFEQERQGTALGIFGAGNVGAAVTNFGAPFLVVALGWEGTARVYAIVLAVTAVLFFLLAKTDPEHAERKRTGRGHVSIKDQLEPLKNVQVWRFATYYFFVFGGFVALASFLPRYYVGAYGLELTTAGVFAGLYSLPGSVFRALGGWMSDKMGARWVMYFTFIVSLVLLFIMSYPQTAYTVMGIDGPITFKFGLSAGVFVALTVVLGFAMSLGKAAVFKHIPVYYPHHVGSIGGLVGMIGGLGGFILPIAFGILLDQTGIWTAPFMLLFLLVGVSTVWMHVAIRRMERARHPALALETQLSDLPQEPHPKPGTTLAEWHPEDTEFWDDQGQIVASRNLWISIPALLLAFAVWMVWSVVVAKLPVIGFDYSTAQLFWLASLPGLSGATLRIFYSFMVPIFGGRLWTTLSTASLLVPALGIGFAVQNPNTSYSWFLVLALLCGFGGGNFASSMANIAYFFPKKTKGNALALNAGLGNLGVSVMQFLVPIVIVTGVFGSVGGEAQTLADGSRLWLQNAGFIWAPFIVLSTLLAWFGMNDIAAAKASLGDQLTILARRHNWIMAFLYTGTFGSFIGYSAGFPLLMKTQFPEVNALSFAFLGPLVGALSRAGTGWVSDKFGGGRVTFWTFLGMIVAVWGVLQFLPSEASGGNFWGFFACFMALFLLTGVGNASTFQMIPSIMRQEIPRLMPQLDEGATLKTAERESAAIIAFTSAIAAYGAFFIPKAYGTSISMTGAPNGALWAFLIFYVACVAVTWTFYSRKSAPVPC
ncbi:Nitrite facilitator 1 [Thalassovita gelatinovora]|uniref:Nitrite facilitator 1 n=1 Tax=Thalassovita gelatinovora TaxID=53501 RepID=A0A0P1FVV9_THAGE|nr:MFS transporter [Thalassovita gelatinovora]QIZ81302.1 MFS transporter [Thalassovita gelatinovora]CUH64540.1 Nitrite facilitator 1 [Thalassovita gelatinovora]SEP96564.1 MFS transporter, NNP family, nitrate/nitrite transporter [Thalassovita gelatinovora]